MFAALPSANAVLAPLLPTRLPPLGPGTPDRAVRPKLAALSVEAMFPNRAIVDPSAARCCLAGLWLAHDYLDESHAISQEIDSADGSYWHAIVHRREPDYWNSKYWFRRVGQHAIFPALADAASELAAKHPADEPADFLKGQRSWDPFRFVDLCEAIARGRSQSETLAREVAQAEWLLLFEHCYQRAIG